MFKPVGHTGNLYDRIVEEIKTAIEQGKLNVGDRLPPERELARQFGVSRTSIRDALKILAGIGLISIRHGHGIFVTQVNPKENLLAMKRDAILDLFEIRLTLEPQAAAWASKRGSSLDRNDLYEKCALVYQEAQNQFDLSKAAAADANFHLTVANMSQNKVYARLMGSLLDLLRQSRNESLNIPNQGLLSMQEHLTIARNIQEQKENEAKNSMHHHLVRVQDTILYHLGQPRP